MADYEDRPLIGYLPNVLKGVREYQAIMNGEQPEIFDLFNNIQTALDNQFVSTATEYGVKRWEAILNITPKATMTLDERKFTILTRFAEQLPYTYRKLRQMLGELCGAEGYKIDLDTGAYELRVQVALTALNNLNDVDAMLKRVCPANLIIILTIEFNQHYKLQPLTHGELSAKTHYQLRNEVL